MASKKTSSTNQSNRNLPDERDENRDPITKAPGAHPVGVGLGAAAGGAAAGAAAGTVAGPVGTVVGAVAGAIVGGYAGKAAAEAIDPTAEEAYWRENYSSRPYYDSSLEYDHYKPAYQYGWESRGQYRDKTFDEIEPELEQNWKTRSSKSSLGWDKAKHAARDAWNRVERVVPGDSDRDGN